MWAGVTSEIIIGQYFFERSVTGESYLEMSQLLIPELDRVGLLNTVVLQQDGAPGHFWTSVREWLNTSFPSCIG
ncbi:hypothetical protein ANN_26882 [Periplaneta americana]|uniref:Uncharacterized protein n=1 Tax=Periplaneta americana TaxID=6978 RepID=A0ABQ8RWG5_PERAM|nr:hypothetical protein ANN_26882 [Periplaneta americana]